MSLEADVLVVGAGPAGLIAALTLSRHGIASILVERNVDPTKWPKMDLTNCRSMELLRRLNIADEWRSKGVPGKYSSNVLYSTGLAEGGETFAKWELPSPDAWQEQISKKNDGSQPREPWQRGSQSLFETYLRDILDSDPLVDVRYGTKFEKLIETETGVESHLTQISGAEVIVKSKYLLACDGGGSRARRSVGIESVGGPVPGAMFLVHFKSRDVNTLLRQGRFWHLFLTHGAALISQDEQDTWTLHTPISPDADITQIDPYQMIQKSLAGSMDTSVAVQVDEILVSSIWRPNIYLSSKYRSSFGRVFLAGDSAHQTIPTGGYGMNTALGDSFDIGWKLAAVLKGYGGPALLASYEAERRPVAAHNLEQARKHWAMHSVWQQWARDAGEQLFAQSNEGYEVRERIRKYVERNNFENQDFGTELDYRYRDSPVIARNDDDLEEPPWERSCYTPSTWPGMRAPCLPLADEGKIATAFAADARKLKIPLKEVHLPNESHLRQVWERDAVLIRPDDHVAWRAGSDAEKPLSNTDIILVLITVVGRTGQHEVNA